MTHEWKVADYLFLREVIYIFIIYHIPYSWLYLSNGYDFKVWSHDRWNQQFPGTYPFIHLGGRRAKLTGMIIWVRKIALKRKQLSRDITKCKISQLLTWVTWSKFKVTTNYRHCGLRSGRSFILSFFQLPSCRNQWSSVGKELERSQNSDSISIPSSENYNFYKLRVLRLAVRRTGNHLWSRFRPRPRLKV